MALVLALILLLALTALAHGTLLLAVRERRASATFLHALKARQAAEAAFRLGIREDDLFLGEHSRWQSRLTVSGETDDGAGYRGFLRWLGPEFFLLEGEGTSRGWPGKQRKVWIGWSLSPVARVGAFQAAAEIGGMLIRGQEAEVGTLGSAPDPEGWTASACSGYRTTIDSLLLETRMSAWGPLPEGAAPGGDATTLPPLGLLDEAKLLALAGAAESGALSSVPPLDSAPGCPGGGAPVFLGTEGELVLEGGRTCGLLLAGGDLRIRGETAFQGLALVGGDVVLDGGATFEGMMRVGGDLLLPNGARFLPSLCPALRALDGIGALRDPLILSRGYRLYGF